MLQVRSLFSYPHPPARSGSSLSIAPQASERRNAVATQTEEEGFLSILLRRKRKRDVPAAAAAAFAVIAQGGNRSDRSSCGSAAEYETESSDKRRGIRIVKKQSERVARSRERERHRDGK